MFDIGWSEIFVIAVIALLVIGPRDLPKVLREIGRWARAARRLAREFQASLDDALRESEIDELRRDIRETIHGDEFKLPHPLRDPTGPPAHTTRESGDRPPLRRKDDSP